MNRDQKIHTPMYIPLSALTAKVITVSGRLKEVQQLLERKIEDWTEAVEGAGGEAYVVNMLQTQSHNMDTEKVNLVLTIWYIPGIPKELEFNG